MSDDVVRAHVLMPRETVEEKLRRSRMLLAAERVAGSLADEDTPGWNTPEEAQEWVRSMRQAGNDRPLDADRR